MNVTLETITPSVEPNPGGRTGMGIIWLLWGFVASVFLFIGLGYLMVQGDQWYGQSLKTAQPADLWVWPWGWPGPNVVESIYSWMGIKPWDQTDHVMRILGSMPRFTLAIVVNATIAMMPLLAFAVVSGAVRNVRTRLNQSN